MLKVNARYFSLVSKEDESISIQFIAFPSLFYQKKKIIWNQNKNSKHIVMNSETFGDLHFSSIIYGYLMKLVLNRYQNKSKTVKIQKAYLNRFVKIMRSSKSGGKKFKSIDRVHVAGIIILIRINHCFCGVNQWIIYHEP